MIQGDRTVRALVESGFSLITDWRWLLVAAATVAGLAYWRVKARSRPQITEIPSSLLARRTNLSEIGHKPDVTGPAGGRLLRISEPPPGFPKGYASGVADHPRPPLSDHGAADSAPPPPEESIHVVIDLNALESDPNVPKHTIDLAAYKQLVSLPADPWS